VVLKIEWTSYEDGREGSQDVPQFALLDRGAISSL